MLTMSTLMMPAPAMTAMSTPAPLQVANKLEPAAKLSINHNTTNNKAGTVVFLFCFRSTFIFFLIPIVPHASM